MKNHDPLERRLPDEPYLIFLARDLLSSPLGRVYASLREGKYDQARLAYDALERAAKLREIPAHKQKEQSEHAWSVRNQCDAMDTWRLVQLASGEKPVMVLPQREDIPAYMPDASIEAIKNAKPPLDSDDAT